MWSVDRRFFAWFSVAAFFALQYVLRVMPNTLSGEIMERFNVGAIALGQFSALYYAGYTIAHIPLGVLIDKYGPKKVVPACIALTFLGAAPMLFGSWKFVQIGRVLTGMSSVASAISIFKVSKMYFAGTKVARMISIAVVMGLLGAMYGGMPMLSLVEDFGWSKVFLAFIAGGCVLAVFAYFLFDDAGATESGSVYKQIRSVISNKRLIMINLLGGCMIGPLVGFADGWATAFLSEVCGVSHKASTTLPAALFAGGCIGSLVIGYMLEKSYNGWNIIIYCGLFTIAAFAAMLTGNCNNGVSAFILLLTVGICSAYQIVTTFKSIEYVDSGSVAMATAISNMVIMFFGYFFHTVISLVINAYWDGKVVSGQAVYGSETLVKAMLVIPAGVLIGTVGTAIMKHYSKDESPAS
ncbi:MFS transporter [Anaplasma centrale]|uniref:MFS transporter n=1 Tax=Anaplasma centrale TaxID=769 RepID=UPI0005A1431A|nr:MFS transporter [Anaplasma centrale]